MSVVDRVYARALFDAALDEDRLEQVLEHRDFRARIELRVAQRSAQLGHVADRGGEVGELLAHLLQAPRVLRSLEEGLRVRAVDGGYRSAPVRVVLPGREKQAWEGRREWEWA